MYIYIHIKVTSKIQDRFWRAHWCPTPGQRKMMEDWNSQSNMIEGKLWGLLGSLHHSWRWTTSFSQWSGNKTHNVGITLPGELFVDSKNSSQTYEDMAHRSLRYIKYHLQCNPDVCGRVFRTMPRHWTKSSKSIIMSSARLGRAMRMMNVCKSKTWFGSDIEIDHIERYWYIIIYCIILKRILSLYIYLYVYIYN